ncbi:MAG: hypothetical protein HFH45_03465 [Bacilli bacterium]|nr:hypothetical protein [Bacilli bacterium]
MTKFKVEDKVKTLYGEGKIVKIDDSLIPYHVHLNDGIHWWCCEDRLELIKQNQTIHIYNDGTKTTAILKEGKKVVDKAEAICHKDDEFDFAIGAELAFNRLINKEIKVGDTVEVVDNGKSYTAYADWFEENNCKDLEKYFVYHNRPKEGLYAEVLAIGGHKLFEEKTILAIQTAFKEVYLIELDGVKKVTE